MANRDLLIGLGLLTYEADVYEALVSLKSAKVQDIARAVSVPRPQIYVALGKLIEKGMVNETRGKVTLYSAVTPRIAFKGVLKREEETLKAKADYIAKLDETFRRASGGGIPASFVLVLKGRQVKHFIDEQVANAKDRVLILLKSARGQSAKSLEGSAKAELSLLERGVKVQCLYEEDSLADENMNPILKRVVAAGEEGRVVETVPMNMMVFDDKAAMFSLTDEQGSLTVFVFTHPDLIHVTLNNFEFLWEQGRSLKQALRTRPAGANPKSQIQNPKSEESPRRGQVALGKLGVAGG
jgi:sugar-specific transcriptional regulator TrmB